MKSHKKTERVELHFTKPEVAVLEKLADTEGRKRKNFCENELRKLINKHLNTKGL